MSDDDLSLNFSFQWVVGDSQPIEAGISRLIESDYNYTLTIFSRMASFGVTFLVAWLLLPEASTETLALIVLAATLSIWTNGWLSRLANRKLKELRAKDVMNVGWQDVTIDPRGLFWIDDTSETYVSWQGIKSIEVVEGALWFHTGDVAGYFLPARLFEKPADLDACIAALRDIRSRAVAPVHLYSDEDELVRH